VTSKRFTFRVIHARSLAAVLVVVSACGDPGNLGVENELGGTLEPTSSAVATISVANKRQTIAGFGASSAWTAPNLSDQLSDQLFSAEVGIGLSLLRLRIAPDGTSGEFPTARKAIIRGARVWAAPWSPPGEWKDSGTAENGGSLLPERYGDYAEQLASFVAAASAADVPLLYLSAQNEPNYVANWETCRWSETDLTRFIRDHLGPAIGALGLDTQLLAPETQDWFTLQSFGNAILADDAASAHVGAIAVHGYGGEAFNYAAPAAAGKDLWVTELDDRLPGESDGDFDPTMTSGLKVARKLHADLTIASVNAWHYWWIMPRTDLPLTNNGALTDGQALTRRAYVMGNYSKFVRPGFSRVQATGAPQRDLLVTAFRDEAGERLVIVASNLGTTDVEQPFAIEGAEAHDAIPWITSDYLALEEQPPVPIVDQMLVFTLPARSVTTFVVDIGNVDEPEPEPVPMRRPVVSDETGCSCSMPARRGSDGALVILALALRAVRARRRAA